MGTKARASRIDPAEYRRYLEDRLSRTRARIKMADAVTGLTIVVVSWVCYLLLVVMLDQIIELPSIVRFMLLVTCLIVTGGILVLRVILPSLNQVNTRFAARSIEAADQRMKNSVLSWVELSEHPEDLPTPILRTIENKAASDLSRVRIEDAIQPRHVLSALYVLASVVVLFCLYSFFTTKSFGASIERVLLPLGATAPPTATQLRITFDPGQADPTEPTPIPADSSITFKASVIRGNPAQVMAYLQADGSSYEEPHELSRSTTVQSEFTLSLHQRQKTFHIRFVANDFHSKQYTIAVTPAPMITEWLLRYTPPSYTGAAPFTSPTPDITGLEGTEVAVEAVTNLPVAANSARIEFKLTKPTASVDMKLMEGSENRIEGKFTLTGDGSYSVLFSDKEGRAPLFRPSNNIRVLKDLPPAIEFTRPAEVESSLPANQPLILAARVKDDIGLRHLMLTIRKKGSEDAPIIFEQGGRPGDVLGQSEAINESIDLAKFKLIPGDVVEYWIEAEDNKLPASNIASTRADSRLVKITKPLEAAPPAKDGERNDATETEDKDPQKNGEKSDDPNPKDDEKPGDERTDSSEKNPGKEPSDKNDPSSITDPSKDEQNKQADDAKGNQPGEKSSDEEATANDLKRKPGNEEQRQEANGKKSNEENANKLSDEDRRDLDKLREYFKKKDGSKETGNAEENKNAPSDSKDREAATPSKENNDRNAGGQNKSGNNRDQGNEPGEKPSGEKKGNSASTPDANMPESSKEESAEKKENSEGKKNNEGQKSPADSGDKSKSAGSNKSGEPKSDEKPNGNGASGSEEEKKAAETNEEKPDKQGDSKPSEKNENPSTDKEKSPSEPNTGRKPTDENQAGSKGDNSKSGSTGEEKPSSDGESSKSPKSADPSKSSGNSDSTQKSGESQDKPSSSDGEKPSNATENSSSKEGDKPGEEKQPRAGSEAKPNSSGEKQSSSAGEKQSGQESQSQSGESGSSDDSSGKEDKQNKESKEGKPTPGSEGENDKPSKRSTKVGNDESSAASKGNSDGSSQEGPSQSPGQKGPGSPSDQKGNESKGPGDKQRAEGEKGTPSQESSPSSNGDKEKSSDKQSSEKQQSGEKQQGNEKQDGKEKSEDGQKQEGNQKQAGEKQQGGEKPSSSDDSKESGNKEGQNGSEKNSSSGDKQGSEGKSSNANGEQTGSESKSSEGSDSSEKQSPPKEEEKSSDSNESGSKESEQPKTPNENSPKGSSSSTNKDAGDAKPSNDSSKNGSADAQQSGPATQPSGGKQANQTSDKGDGGVLDNSGDQADPDDLKKGSNLILKKLQDQMANKKVDPDLLKSMGWTEDDARKFYERMKQEQSQSENVAPVEREQRRKFGQGTDLRKSTGKSAGSKNDSIQDLHSGRRTPVPPQVRKRFEAYMKSLSETSSGKPADKPTAPPAAGTK